MEDAVAVVMLTVLSTLIQFGGEKTPPLAQIIGALSAFIVFLVLSALFFVPRLLLRLTEAGRPELRTIMVIGLLFSVAWLAQQAGYSLALGSFLLGVVIASTPQKLEISRVFEGLRDMSAQCSLWRWGCWSTSTSSPRRGPWCWRSPPLPWCGAHRHGSRTGSRRKRNSAIHPRWPRADAVGGVFVCHGPAGSRGWSDPQSFFPAAVGASLLTALIAPSVMRRSDPISAWADRRLPLMLPGMDRLLPCLA